MISNGVIQSFRVLVNPIIFGYEKECYLRVKNIDKTIKEEDLFKKISLLGDIFIYINQLEGAAVLFVVFIRPGAEGMLGDLLKPAEVESIFGRLRVKPINAKIHNSDLEIMKCLLSDARMRAEDIAKETSLSPKTVARRLEKMKENNILQFTFSTDSSSKQLTGFIDLHVLIDVDAPYHENVVERIYNEMQEYILHPPDDLYNIQLTIQLAVQRNLSLRLSVVLIFLRST